MACLSNSSCGNACLDNFGCPSGVNPDFVIRRHDTKPPLEIIVRDCDGAIDLTDTVLEVSMWAKAKLKQSVSKTDTYFALADNIGFSQALVDDIIVVNQIRNPEQMLITGFDEQNKFIRVQRGYNGSPISAYSKGQAIKIFRVLNGVGETEMTLMDVLQVDGTTEEDVLTESKLVYEWKATDTCVPGCFWFEFKLLKMAAPTSMSMLSTAASITPSFSSFTPSESGCTLGVGVEWARRFPTESEGFLVKIVDSPTSELLV